jgi:hypothetical protein
MVLTVRDFRPYVAVLHRLGRLDLAELIVQDYLDAFVNGFNTFVAHMLDILKATASHTTKKAGL